MPPAVTGSQPTVRSARVGLTDVAGVVHGRLSQGQRRRLALAIALAARPAAAAARRTARRSRRDGRAVVDEVLAAAPAEGRTVLLASHELDLARRFATREVRIVAGRVETHEVPAHPVPMVEVSP